MALSSLSASAAVAEVIASPRRFKVVRALTRVYSRRTPKWQARSRAQVTLGACCGRSEGSQLASVCLEIKNARWRSCNYERGLRSVHDEYVAIFCLRVSLNATAIAWPKTHCRHRSYGLCACGVWVCYCFEDGRTHFQEFPRCLFSIVAVTCTRAGHLLVDGISALR